MTKNVNLTNIRQDYIGDCAHLSCFADSAASLPLSPKVVPYNKDSYSMCVGLYETGHDNLLLMPSFLLALHSFPLAVSLKLLVPLDSTPPAFASYDCKTVHSLSEKEFCQLCLQLLETCCCYMC